MSMTKPCCMLESITKCAVDSYMEQPEQNSKQQETVRCNQPGVIGGSMACREDVDDGQQDGPDKAVKHVIGNSTDMRID